MISNKFSFNGITIGDFADIIAFKNRTRDWVVSLRQVTGFTSPEVRNAERAFAGNHGIIDYQSFIGKRTLTFQGDIIGRSEEDVREAIKQLQIAFSLPAVYTPSSNGYHTLQWETQAGEEQYQCNAKVSTLPRIDKAFKVKNHRTFFVALKCEDPRLYSQELITANLRYTWYQAGQYLPMYLPTYLSSVSIYEKNLYNGGNFGTAPIIRINGGSVNPQVWNKTHDIKMKLNATIADDDYYEIDVFNHTVKDKAGNNKINSVDSDSDWLWLMPGDNYIDFTDERPSPLISGDIPEEQVSFSYRYASI